MQLTHDDGISVAPSLSPDGAQPRYTGYQSGYADVYEIDLGSGAAIASSSFPAPTPARTYSPDGHRLAVTLSKDGNPELYVTSAAAAARIA